MPCWATGNCRWRSICGSPPLKTTRSWTFATSPLSSATSLERVDWRRDLHFQTCTTIDTLDYSSGRLNEGSKLVIAAAGPPRRTLADELRQSVDAARGIGIPEATGGLAGRFGRGRPADKGDRTRRCSIKRRHGFAGEPDVRTASINEFPLVVVVDESDFAARTLENFLWTTFTRSNPASDIYGIEPSVSDKHWGCHGSLVIDARSKPHHAPPLVEDPAVTRRVEARPRRAVRCTG